MRHAYVRQGEQSIVILVAAYVHIRILMTCITTGIYVYIRRARYDRNTTVGEYTSYVEDLGQ